VTYNGVLGTYFAVWFMSIAENKNLVPLKTGTYKDAVQDSNA
jgi:hypothetical protein